MEKKVTKCWPFIKVQSVFMANQTGQNYSTGVKCAVQGHENKINNLPSKPGKSHGRRSLEGCSPWGH